MARSWKRILPRLHQDPSLSRQALPDGRPQRGLCECVYWEGTPLPEGAAGVRILKEVLPHLEQAGPLPGPQPARVTALTVPSVWLTGLPMPAVGALLSTALTEGTRWAGLEALGPVPAWLAGLTAACVCRARLILLAVATAGGKRSSWEAPGANGRSAHPGLQGSESIQVPANTFRQV